MRFGGVLVVLVAALAWVASASASPVALHPPLPQGQTNTDNPIWAGYAATGGPYTFVSASWTQPTATCASGETSYSSFWVGLDGNTSRTVEQIGTDADCKSGTPTYYAWYEPYPKFPVTVPLTIHPNDSIYASVTYDGNAKFTVSITVNGGTPYTASFKLHHAALSSAEVIAEAPSSNHGPFGALPLTNFGHVDFTSATATVGNGTPASLYTYSTDEWDIVSSSGTPEATVTSPLDSSGNFTVTRDS